MKFKCNLFGFLSRGVTATHPLCSVFILSILFVFCFSYISVSASSVPSNLPLSDDWQFSQALDAYGSLTLEQQKISDFLVGCQGNAFAGLSNYNLEADYDSYDATISGISNFGNKIWNNIKNAYLRGYEIGSGVRNKLSSFLGSTVEYASGINISFSAWLNNIGMSYNSSSEFRIGYYPDTTKDYINYLGDQSLYDWQKSSLVLDPKAFAFDWYYQDISNANISATYYQYFSSMTNPKIRMNEPSPSNYNEYTSSDFFAVYHNIFANTTTNIAYLCDDYGNMAPSSFSANVLTYIPNVAAQYYPYTFYTRSINLSGYSTLQALYDAIEFRPDLLISSDSQFRPNYSWYVCLADFVQNLYVGSSWSDKGIWTENFDLNFAPVSNYVTVYSPNQPIYLNIIGFVQDLYDNDKTIKKSVEDNTIISDGTPTTSDIWDTINKYFTRPDSGIHIGIDFFKLPDGTSPLFDTYIADLWRNTKDMVLYCGDILNVFTLDGGGGLAYVVYGAIGVGVIGGIFSKFLL